jgi:hypothetical protein
MPTTAPETQAQPGEELGPDAHLYVTLDEADENKVLELVRVEGNAYFVRERSAWIEVDADDDDSIVWGRAEDVSPDVLASYDESEADNGGYADFRDIEPFVIADEDGAPA